MFCYENPEMGMKPYTSKVFTYGSRGGGGWSLSVYLVDMKQLFYFGNVLHCEVGVERS